MAEINFAFYSETGSGFSGASFVSNDSKDGQAPQGAAGYDSPVRHKETDFSREDVLKKDTWQDYQERMLRVLIHIRQNLDQSPSLEELAGVANFSPFHFHRIFRGMTGESLKAHLKRLRIEKAASRLRQSNDPIIRIALDSGFESHAAFSRAFKIQLGETPSRWRTISEEQPLSTERNFLPGTRKELSMEVKIVKKEQVRVAFIRHTGPYAECGSAWGKLCTHLGALGYLGDNPAFIGLSYDDPGNTPPQDLITNILLPLETLS